MHRIWGFLLPFFLAISIAVKQHFLRFKNQAMNDEEGEEEVEESWAENELRGERKASMRTSKKLILCLLFKCAIYKNLLAIDLITKTHLSLAVLLQTQPTSQFLKMFFFRCAVSRLFRLGCLVFLILQVFFGCAAVICNIFATTHTLAHLCISAQRQSVWWS